ncbi:MAG: tetratricopeptide repeat protein [Planctomycetes bacterium]|nr:tetratricopeptide repeat protein [Planctomycetota bacterium]
MVFKRWQLRRRLRRAHELERVGRTAEARSAYRSIAAEAAGELKAIALAREGACATRMSDLMIARQLFQAARDAAPDDADHWLNYANACHRLGDGLGADEAYVEALKRAPNRPDILYYQSVYYADKLSKAGLEGAKRALRALLEVLKTSGSPQHASILGFPREIPLAFIRNLALEKELVAEGLAALKEFANWPGNHEAARWIRPAALNHRGLLLANVGRYDEAVEDYRAALAARPSDDVTFNLGMAHVRRHDWAEARKTFTAYSKKHPASAVTTFGLAMMAETSGDAKEATRLYKFFLERVAQSPPRSEDLISIDVARTWVDHARAFLEAMARPAEGGVFEERPEKADQAPEGTEGDIQDRPRGT